MFGKGKPLLGELRQHLDPGGRGLRLGRLLQDRVLELLEKDLAELNGGVDVELLSRLLPDRLLEGAEVLLHALRHLVQEGHVDRDAEELHARENGGQGPLDLPVDLVELGPRLEVAAKQGRERRGCGRAFGEPSVRRLDRVLLRQPAVDDAGLLVGGELPAEALEEQRLDLRASDAGREDVLGEADVEESARTERCRAARRRSSGLASARRERRVRTVEGVPAREDGLGRPLGDLHGRSLRRREEPVPVVREKRDAVGPRARRARSPRPPPGAGTRAAPPPPRRGSPPRASGTRARRRAP